MKQMSIGQGSAVVFIPKGSGVRQIRFLLAEKGLIEDDIRFLILARLTGLAGHLKAGEYRISFGTTPLQVLQILEKGIVLSHRVTIPEGLNLWQVTDILVSDGWVNREQFLELLHKPSVARLFGLKQLNLEGYLFPDTYTLVRGELNEKAIIALMVQGFHKVWQSLDWKNDLELTRHQIITLASLVEKETGAPEERTLVASVFHNRLRKGMRLQSDPTVLYGVVGEKGPITRSDLKRETPYNTYVIKGLPPGPICSPGRASIQAVLKPAETTFLYFVSKNDGTHYFSKTLREHNKAVRKYRK